VKIPFLNKADIVLGVVLLILGFGSMAFVRISPADSSVVEISVRGQIVKTLPLSENCEYELSDDYGFNKIVVNDGSVYISESDCHGKDCVAIGRIKSEGQIILCLPHRLMVRIVGGGEIDASV